ncbi:hypothetical protein STENM327S_04667 [Streptomyces tendae]
MPGRRRRRVGDGQGRLEPGQVPALGRRHQREAAFGAGHAQVGHEPRVAGDDRGVDLVGDDPDAVPLRQAGDGRQFAGGVDGAGRVVRAAQQEGRPAAARRGPPELLLQHAQVDPQVRAEGRLDHPPVQVGDELVERRVHRRVDDHRVTGPGDELEHLDDSEHHVGHDGRAFHGQAVPAPPLAGEAGEGLGVGGAGGVAGVAEFHGPRHGAHDGPGERHVHLGHPQRQYVRGVGAPLHARTPAQLVRRECVQGVRFTGLVPRDAGHGAKIGRRDGAGNRRPAR